MRRDRQQLKAQLVAQYAQQLDEMMERLDEEQALDLDEIETLALTARARVGETLTQALVDSESTPAVPGPVCSGCQREMHFKGLKPKRVRTRSGEVTVKRAYYYCTSCRQGCFPPG